MKNDLITTIVASILGVLIAYFVSNMIIDTLAKSTYSVKNVDSSVGSDLAIPDEEVFNYKALNPTVEVYVGDCTEVNMYGECVDESSNQIDQGIIDEDSSDTSDSDSSDSDNPSQNQRNR